MKYMCVAVLLLLGACSYTRPPSASGMDATACESQFVAGRVVYAVADTALFGLLGPATATMQSDVNNCLAHKGYALDQAGN